MGCWNKDALRFYYEGIRYGEYPSAIMDKLSDILKDCRSMIDICSGPGAFTLWALERGWQVLATDMDETALSALENTAGANNALTIIRGDLLQTDLPAKDLAIAACCFYEETAKAPALGKMLDLGQKAAVFIQHDGETPYEFGTEGLPAGPRQHNWAVYNMEKELKIAAEERGLTINNMKIRCDFGCIFHPGNEYQLQFISRKTGVTDLELLASRLMQRAKQTPNGLWLPNIKQYSVSWVVK